MKHLFHFFTFTVTLLLVHAFASPAHAATAAQLAAQINGITGLSASVDGSNPNLVVVSGNVHSVRTTLTLNIDTGVTVRWGALYMGSAQPLFSIVGDGTFEVGAGGWIYNTDSGNVINAGDSINVVVTGESAAGSGVVQATTGSAIHCTGTNIVTVEGYGSVLSDVVSNIKPVINMINENDNTENVIIKDNASVWAMADGATNSGYCIQTYGNVRVDGGNIHSASGRGRGINLSGASSTATINGGRVWVSGASTSVAISTANTLGPAAVDNTQIIVNGGTVEATGEGMAIRTVGTHSAVNITGGVVASTTGYAISNETNGDNTVTVSGGLVIGYGKGVTGASPNVENIFYTNGGNRVTVSGNGIAAAWNQGHSIYVEGEENDLLSQPTDATITWHNDHATGGGISYANGANEGFFPLPPRVVSDFGLIFDAASGKMYRNLNGDLVFDANEKEAGNEYTEGKPNAWDSQTGKLTLKGFHWSTMSQVGLMIVGDAVLRLDGNSSIVAHFKEGRDGDDSIPRPAYYGIYSDMANITIEGSGFLMALGATEYLSQTPDPDYGPRMYCGIGTGGNITFRSGTLMSWGFSEYKDATSIGIRAAQIDLLGGMLTVGGFAQAYENTTAVNLPAAYGYWTTKNAMDYTTDIGELTFFAGVSPYNTPYMYAADNEIVHMRATSFATVADVTVSGIIELPMVNAPAQTTTVTLYDDVVSSALSGADATSWFTGLPAGVTVKADAAAGSNTITLSFTGTPLMAGAAVLNITLPATVAVGGTSIPVQPNPNAKVVIADRAVLSLTLHDQTATYTGNEVSVTPAVLAGTKEGAVPAAITYTYTGISNGGVSYNASTPPTDAGTYTVTVTVASDNSYFGATATAALTVEKATPEIKLHFKVTTYTGTPVPVETPVLIGSTTVGSLMPSLVFLYESTDGNSYSSDQPPTNTGHYKVTVSTVGNDNHHAATTTTTLIIGEVSLNLPDISHANISKVYDGTSLAIGQLAVPSGYDGTVTYSYTGTLLDGTPYAATPPATDHANGAPTDAGSYTVTISLSGDSNYGDIAVNSHLTITKAPATVTIANKIAPYTGGPVTADAPTCSVAGATLTTTYKNTDGISYAETATPPSGSGMYEVKVMYNGNNNYLPAQAAATLTIVPSKTPTLALADKTVVYDEQPHSIGTAAIHEVEAQGFAVTYTYSSSGYPASATPPTNAGVYTVKATTSATTFNPLQPESYFAAGEETAVLIIERASQTITFDLPEKRFGDAPFNVNAMLTNNPAVDLPLTYQSGNPAIATIDNTGQVTIHGSGQVAITVSQAGNENYAPVSVTHTLVITSDSSGMLAIVVNGEGLEVADEMQYVMPCGSTDNAARITLTVPTGATVTYEVVGDATVYPAGTDFEVSLDRPQLKTVAITVTSHDGMSTHTYHLTLERRFPFDQIVLMRWDNTLTVINNPANNGGYTFDSYRWYRNGEAFADGQSWSAGAYGEVLSESDLYYVAVTSTQFEGTLRTCESSVTLRREMNVITYPNPVSAGQTFRVRAEASDEAALEGVVIEMYNAMGNLVGRFNAQGRDTEISAGYPAGTYFLVWNGKDGFRKVVKILVSK